VTTAQTQSRGRAAQTEHQAKMTAARQRVEQQQAEQRKRLAAINPHPQFSQQVVEHDVERERAEQRSVGRMLLSAEDLWAFGIRYSKVQLWKQVKAGLFPAPIKISANRNAWIRDEIVAWIKARVNERDGGAA
jgi:predicted DNA-binding transcriptional regulator AlpA